MQFSTGRNEGATEIAQEAEWCQCGGFGYNKDEAERRISGGSTLLFYFLLIVSKFAFLHEFQS